MPPSMPIADRRILALDATSARCSAVLWSEGHVIGLAEREGPTGEAALLPRMVADLLASQGIAISSLAAIACAIGPGSFTGIRASLALAHGLAVGADLPVIGVTVAEALAMAAQAEASSRAIWCALDARSGRLFLHRGARPEDWEVVMLEEAPLPTAPILLTGDGAAALAGHLQARGCDVALSTATHPHAREVAMVAALRLANALPPLDASPLYIDPPRALLPRGGLRPPPVAAWSH